MHVEVAVEWSITRRGRGHTQVRTCVGRAAYPLIAEKSGPRGHKRMTYGPPRGGRVSQRGRVFSRAESRRNLCKTVIRYGTLHLVKAGVDAYAASAEIACPLEIGDDT